jgi:Ser/Thr protein kinase RdoA (MazF antagonist)
MSSPYDRLSPEIILGAAEEWGFRPTGELVQLNSYENRVFDIRLERESKESSSPSSVIAKFYRPGRWTPDAIQDEHEFLAELATEGVPAVAPLTHPRGGFTKKHGDFVTAIFPKRAGRMPQEFLEGELRAAGRLLARLHNVGARRPARHRVTLTTDNYGRVPLAMLERFAPPAVWSRYREAAESILDFLEENMDVKAHIRIHGDCHKGNLLKDDRHDGVGFYFVDFDDFVNGPVVQDFWMLLSGSVETDDQAAAELEELVSGYEELREAPPDFALIEPLRGLRIINYAGWIASRWSDRFFPTLFPGFTGEAWWLDECLRLEQIAGRST